MKKSDLIRPVLSQQDVRARGEGVEMLETTPRSQESNDQVYVLTTEELTGVSNVETFNTKEEALEALKEIKKGLRKRHIKFETAEPSETPVKCEEAVYDKRGRGYYLQTVEDAVDPTGKLIWSVNQSVFNQGEMSPWFEWRVLYASKEEAVKLFKERLELYQMQADADSSIRIEMGKCNLSADIYKNGQLVVDLFCESAYVGTISNVGTVILR